MLTRPFHGLLNSGDYLLRPGFNLGVCLCNGKYLNVHEKLLFYNLHVALCYNCMNEKTFRRLFPKVKLSVCPYEIQNFVNSITDISILGQFRTYLQFRGEKYLNTFIVTNTNDCPNLLSHGATFRMGVLLPNYPEENVVKGENVPNFKFGTSAGTSTGTSSNVFQILQDLRLKQYQETSSDPSKSRTS